jgi:hypothetical protein
MLPRPPTHAHSHGPSGRSQAEHPLDAYFRELLRRRRKELLRRKSAALKSLQVRGGLCAGLRGVCGDALAAVCVAAAGRGVRGSGGDGSVRSVATLCCGLWCALPGSSRRSSSSSHALDVQEPLPVLPGGVE